MYAREHRGAGPAFVLLHGFPDNHHIYDPLAQLLADAGRHVIAFDFLGFGLSAKPAGFAYGYDQQLADLQAVIEHFHLNLIVPVAHDAGGFAAINLLLADRDRVSHLVLLNTFYANAPTLRAPELIQFFATPGLGVLAGKMANDPKQMNFLLSFQQTQFKQGASEAQKRTIDEAVRPIIGENFGRADSATPAFVKIVANLFPQMGKNTAFVPKLKLMSVPCTIVWGKQDAYLDVGVAEDFAAIFAGASLHLIEGGHWPQLDLPEEVASHLLTRVAAIASKGE